MKLKRLTLQGYKTFATKTEFLFDEGITAVVGPNGSGKSNIADALRWVLGEQSYSTLRGKRTTDMIFAGSQSRPRAGMAQVVLTLDNSDGWLPIDYTEVEISRRAHQSGDNEYLLNGQRVRLKDITDLLATSGLAQRTYTIIGQGLIDKALSLRSEERRALFEEAAGINHYKARRAETLRRLQETQRNLERVYDILNEIRPRLTSLKRQATRAQNYEQIAVDLRHLLRIWYGYRWEQAKDSLRLARQAANEAEQVWESGRRSMMVQQENMNGIRSRIDRTERRLLDNQTERDEVRTQLERARREMAIMQERLQSIERQLGEIGQELPLLVDQRTAAETDLAHATSDLESAQTNLRQSQGELQQFNATFQTTQASITSWQKALQTGERDYRQAQNKLAQAEGQRTSLQERLRERETTVSDDEAPDSDKWAQTIEQQTAVYQSARERAKTLNEQRQTQQEGRQTLIRELKTLRREVRDQERSLNRSRSDVAKLEARVDLLGQMRQKEIKGSAGLLGQFASQISIPNDYRRALEAALEARLATLIVDERTRLEQLLKKNRGQVITAVALDHVRSTVPETQPPAGAIGWADALVSSNSNKVQPVVELLLRPILLVETDAAAYDIALSLPAGSLAVSLNGFVVYAGGLVRTSVQGDKNSVLAQEEAWRTAQKELEKRQAGLGDEETAVSSQQTLIQEKQSAVDKLQGEEQRLGRLLNEANQRAAQAQRKLDQAQQQQSFWQRQQESQRRELVRLRERLTTMETDIAERQTAVVKLEATVQSARVELEALPIAEAQQQRLGLRQEISAAQTILAGRQAVVDSRRTTLNQLERQLARLQGRENSLKKQQSEMSLTNESATLQKWEDQLERLNLAIRPLQKQVADYRSELASLRDKTAVLQKQSHDLETRYTQAKVRLTQQENQVEGLQDRIKADLGIVALTFDEEQTGATPLPMEEVVDVLPQVDTLPEDIEKTIQTYRGQLQRMGAINPDAPQEFAETQQRFDFLTQQVEDLNKTDEQLREVIQELDELTSKAFGATVEKVNVVFGMTFTQLFGGGSARLELTDPDDLTVSGVEIIARLPNRREQGLALLSGGERSLTAAALIFSLLKVSPTPFCVMDEVDAALDEANITRFRDLLRELGIKTQIVIITHNRGTVQAAQTIYGISMGTDSASQAISIKPEEYVSQNTQLV
ncbi:MAG: chromosome segregation protein SMC [Chloroflexota bacterium]